MNPDIEQVLQDAFKTIESTNPAIGRVLVEPEYESESTQFDTAELRNELAGLLASLSGLDGAVLRSHDGLEVEQLGERPALKSLVRRITLHADSADGPWIEVAPPGNWI